MRFTAGQILSFTAGVGTGVVATKIVKKSIVKPKTKAVPQPKVVN